MNVVGELRRYGVWSGDPVGKSEDPTRCIKKVRPRHTYISEQCRSPRGHGNNGLYCKKHAKSHPSNGKLKE